MTSSKILYVEDEPDIRSIVTMVLRSMGGFEVMECESGFFALAESPKFHPDPFLLDVMMPGMNGPGTLSRLREIPGQSAIPVIFMTAKVQTKEIQDYMDLGALGVIIKPFNPLTLVDQIKEMWQTQTQK